MIEQREQRSLPCDVLGTKGAAELLIQELAANVPDKRTQLALIENRVLATLARIKQILVDLKHLPERKAYEQICHQYADRLQQLSAEHRLRKQQRDNERDRYRHQLQGDALTAALANLTKASQQDSTERQRLKQERDWAIASLAKTITQSEQSIQTLKHYYKTIAGLWQTQMQLAYSAPTTVEPLRIVYQDEALVVIDKPAGLLSVPGRRYHLQDSAVSRLCHQLPEQTFLRPVHRLDQATSGVLAIALSLEAHAALSQQFAQHQVHKTYEAILSHPIECTAGTIDLPLCPDLENRPKQLVNFQKGKTSRTDFRVLAFDSRPRLEFTPRTGRTHQLRVHAAHPQGLNSPIVGDAIYGVSQEEKRLQLHATSLEISHPVTGELQNFTSSAPF